jgi:hypothetical protein
VRGRGKQINWNLKHLILYSVSLQKLTVAQHTNKFPHSLCNPKVHYGVHKSPPLDRILNPDACSPHSVLSESILKLFFLLGFGLPSSVFLHVLQLTFCMNFSHACSGPALGKVAPWANKTDGAPSSSLFPTDQFCIINNLYINWSFVETTAKQQQQ